MAYNPQPSKTPALIPRCAFGTEIIRITVAFGTMNEYYSSMDQQMKSLLNVVIALFLMGWLLGITGLVGPTNGLVHVLLVLAGLLMFQRWLSNGSSESADQQ